MGRRGVGGDGRGGRMCVMVGRGAQVAPAWQPGSDDVARARGPARGGGECREDPRLVPRVPRGRAPYLHTPPPRRGHTPPHRGPRQPPTHAQDQFPQLPQGNKNQHI